VVAEPDRVPGVLAPGVEDPLLLEVREHRTVDVGARDPRAQRGEGDLLRGAHVIEMASHLVGGRPDDHRALQLRVVAPHGRRGLGDQHVAGAELDVVGDRVGPRAPLSDLPPVPRRGAVRR
jgi:hypothetical protein